MARRPVVPDGAEPRHADVREGGLRSAGAGRTRRQVQPAAVID